MASVTSIDAFAQCEYRFYCDSLARVYFGYSPQEVKLVVEFDTDSEYVDSVGTKHFYHLPGGESELLWRVTNEGKVYFGSNKNYLLDLCAEPGDSWVEHVFEHDTGFVKRLDDFPVQAMGETRICSTFLRFVVTSSTTKDTIPNEILYVADGLGIIGRRSANHGNWTDLVQGVLCGDGFHGEPVVSVDSPQKLDDQGIIQVYLTSQDFCIHDNQIVTGGISFELILYSIHGQILQSTNVSSTAKKIPLNDTVKRHIGPIAWTIKTGVGTFNGVLINTR